MVPPPKPPPPNFGASGRRGASAEAPAIRILLSLIRRQIPPPEGRHHRLLRTRQIYYIVIDLCMWHAMNTFTQCLRPAPIASTRPIPERPRLGQQTLRCSPLQSPSVREFGRKLQTRRARNSLREANHPFEGFCVWASAIALWTCPEFICGLYP